jgi:hypothetical protein
MWELVAFATTVMLIPTIAIGLFRIAKLKRAEGLKTPPQIDGWLASEELQTPK